MGYMPPNFCFSPFVQLFFLAAIYPFLTQILAKCHDVQAVLNAGCCQAIFQLKCELSVPFSTKKCIKQKMRNLPRLAGVFLIFSKQALAVLYSCGIPSNFRGSPMLKEETAFEKLELNPQRRPIWTPK